jgi:AraC family transcriptional regulator, transcriptional activator FtrA
MPRTPFTPGTLALVAYDQLRTFEYAIAAEVFALSRPSLGVPWYRSVVVSAEGKTLRGIAGVKIEAIRDLGVLREAKTIVLPGWRNVEERPPVKLLDALQAAHARGARLLSICSGAFVLAAAGLLDGKRATTHWLFADQLRRQYPKVEVQDDVLYVDEGNIITSAGSAAGIDASLHLVRRDYGARIANTVARRMVTAPHREGGQAQFIDHAVPSAEAARDARDLQKLLAWASKRVSEPLSVSTLAERAAMSPRHLLRVFRERLATTPSDWLAQQRCQRARELLEHGMLSHAEVSENCGFASPETFRVAFRRHVGVAPGAYRMRFGRS